MNIEVLYEDKDIVAVNKPAGMLVHGIFDKHGPRHSESTLADWLVERYPEVRNVGDKPDERPGIVHRLDRETSGVMVIARNQETFEYLKSLFQSKRIKKTYVALVWGNIPEKRGVINKPISIVSGSVRRTVFKGRMTREAVTEYEVLQRYTFGKENLTLVKAMPQTGRTHQIRVHFSAIGHSVVGDKVYGKKGSLVFRNDTELERHFLHAQELILPPRVGKVIKIVAALPKELERVLDQLEKID